MYWHPQIEISYSVPGNSIVAMVCKPTQESWKFKPKVSKPEIFGVLPSYAQYQALKHRRECTVFKHYPHVNTK